ncbi:hypothetical protein SBRY_21146 [Actinacidiphila bryophytorum]|uniref:Uncharacterized protein n=1 Tax=Actinacidiphila bryophytorum TaxID=1436133 RepID=A0A9W4EAA6_9ACTN|nr:hypothetical protein SBRY_21146 [Actinacidiphila bryophytorum]
MDHPQRAERRTQGPRRHSQPARRPRERQRGRWLRHHTGTPPRVRTLRQGLRPGRPRGRG